MLTLGTTLLDAEGQPLDPVARAEQRLTQALSEALYDEGPEARVRRLRASILGEPEPAPRFSGLAAWLPPRA